MAHASRKPKLVPVFQATLLRDENIRHCPSSVGRVTSDSDSSVNQQVDGENIFVGKSVRARSSSSVV